MSLFNELRERNVFRISAAYIFTAWLVIQVVETIFPAFGFGDAAVRFVVIAFAIGLIPVLILSWVFEMTPEGLKRDFEVDRSQPIARAAGRKLDRAIIVILVLALSYFVVDKFLAVSTVNNRIAVMPFVNLSGFEDQEYLSDGISEELLNRLGVHPELQVISRSSSFSFKERDVTLTEIAELLDVAFVLEGSVRMQGSQLRIAARLVDTASDRQLWIGSYDRTLDDIFAIQDEISAAIVGSLGTHLNLEIAHLPSFAVTNSEAHDAYLRGRYLIAQWKPNLLVAAVREFERAIGLDPDYALAHAELAIALQQTAGCDSLLGRDCDAEGAMHADLALELNPELAEAHHAKSHQYSREEALTYLRKAVDINPSYSDAWERIMFWYTRMPDRHAERFAVIQKTLSLNPLSVPGNLEYVYSMIERGRLQEAERQIEKFASIDPNGAIVLQGQVSAVGGNWSEYLLAYLKAANNDPDSIMFGRFLGSEIKIKLADIGLIEEAARLETGQELEFVSWFVDPEEGAVLARQRIENDPDSMSDREIGMILAHAGYLEEANVYLERWWIERGKRFSRNDVITALIGESMIAARRKLGDENGANEVLAAMAENIRQFREAGIVMTHGDYSVDYHDGVVAFLQGDEDRGIELIARAAEDGWLIQSMSAFQKERFQNPDFIRIVEKQKARKASERAKILAVVCTNNPSPAIWDPLPETCDEYSASTGN